MAESRSIRHRARQMIAVAFVAIVGLAACGDADDEPAGGVPETTEKSTVTQPSTNVQPIVPATADPTGSSAAFQGVIVARSQEPELPHDAWWVIDLIEGATIDGSARVLVEIASDQMGCGDSMLRIDTYSLPEGTNVSFELDDAAPSARPDWWYTSNETFDSEPAVRGRHFRVDCPPGAEDVAAELAAQRAIWEQEGPDSYEFTLHIEVFGPLHGDYRVTVVNDAPTNVVREDDSGASLSGELPGTIDALFDMLEWSVAADSFVATYDTELGYPVVVSIDHYLNAVDDEFGVDVTSLTPTAV